MVSRAGIKIECQTYAEMGRGQTSFVMSSEVAYHTIARATRARCHPERKRRASH
jgi:hypothetical protein